MTIENKKIFKIFVGIESKILFDNFIFIFRDVYSVSTVLMNHGSIFE